MKLSVLPVQTGVEMKERKQNLGEAAFMITLLSHIGTRNTYIHIKDECVVDIYLHRGPNEAY